MLNQQRRDPEATQGGWGQGGRPPIPLQGKEAVLPGTGSRVRGQGEPGKCCPFGGSVALPWLGKLGKPVPPKSGCRARPPAGAPDTALSIPVTKPAWPPRGYLCWNGCHAQRDGVPSSTAVFKGSAVSLISKINKEMQIRCSKKVLCKSGSRALVEGSAAPCAGKPWKGEGVLFIPGKAEPQTSARSVDTTQRLCLQGYLIVNKSCEEGRNPPQPSPGTLRLSCEHSRCGTGSAG